MTGKARPLVQAVSTILFFLLIVFSPVVYEWGIYPDIFLRVDPLGAIATALSTRSVVLRLWWGIPLILATIFFGRLFCGWVCPLGSILDLLNPGFKKLRRSRSAWPNLRAVKYLILIIVITSAIVGMNLSWLLDPIALLTRAFTTGLVIRLFLPVMAAWIAFVMILLLDLLGRRFWCRNLCPLGALLGLASLGAIRRKHVGGGCDECKLCEGSCPVGMELGRFRLSECLQCQRCADDCPAEAISFGRDKDGVEVVERRAASLRREDLRSGTGKLGISRRSLLASVGAGMAGGLGLRSLRREQTPPVRPPGAVEEADFAAACIRCGECIRICPTGGWRPMLFEAGPLPFLTPKLVSRIGPCEYGCIACGKVCPTGAIRALSIDEKEKTQIGLAGIDRERCLPWLQGVQCLVCNDACPYEAIEMRFTGEVPSPYVNEPKCTGCGICEYECPVEGESAIIVLSAR